MIFKVFAVRDSAATAFLPPFVLPQEGQALRSFRQAINDPEHQWNKAPEDFNLHSLGFYDDETGIITPDPETPIIAKGIALVKPITIEAPL